MSFVLCHPDAVQAVSPRAGAGAVLRKGLSWIALTGALAGALPAMAGAGTLEEVPALPSGQPVTLQEMLVDVKPDGAFTYARFRFVAPDIGQGRSYANVQDDFAVLCSEYALPIVASGTEAIDRIVISLASREIEFGQSDPDTTQFFEAFRIENGACIWEEF